MLDNTLAANAAATAIAVDAWPAWPEYGLVDDLLPQMESWVRAGKRIALATLVRVVGSSPRPVGSEMAVAESGEAVGYVSGGCVEAAVAAEALAALADGRARLLDYGAGSPVIDIQLTCGGRIYILVREIPDPAAYAGRLRTARRRREALTVLSDLRHGGIELVDGMAEAAPGQFARVHQPPTRLLLVGGDPVTLALAGLAPALGIEVALLRPNGPERGPAGMELQFYDRRAIETALAGLSLDPWCAVYSLTHDADIDMQVMLHALASPVLCIGVLGSRRKAEARLAALRAAGVDEARLRRLRLPAGLVIGSRSPQEIALSILGEVVAARAERLRAQA